VVFLINQINKTSGGVMRITKLFLIVFLTFLFAFVTTAQTLERDQVAEKYKWNLSEIYSSTDAWQADVNMLKSEVDKLADFKGTLGESADNLYKALKMGNDLAKTLWRCWTYAGNLSNEDLNISANQALMQQMTALGTKFGEVTAYMEPEILQIP
jgi:oligoendopeptidase F